MSNSALSAPALSFRAASLSDVDIIWHLMQEAFAQSSLPYTIYQSARSIAYLAELIQQQSDESQQRIVVACCHNKPVGYYHAIRHNTDFFVNYIAVAYDARGNGIGYRLLQHFEQMGLSYGFNKLALDVLESNQSVCNWYERHGYVLHSASYHVRLWLNQFAKDDSVEALKFDAGELGRAYREESHRGFSKLECCLGTRCVLIGFIAGHICKLLQFEHADVSYIGHAVANAFGDMRDTLVISNLPSLSPEWSPQKTDKALRLLKVI